MSHYQVLARKWRPRDFDSVVGQPHIVRALKNAILKKKFAHAYLLSGTRGVGKTTVARVIAKAIRCPDLSQNGNPCLQCESCLSIEKECTLDVLEIDGASHNGVEHIRELIENVQYLPATGKHKIYIIDEVHMLSKEAFNALLKVLEAPPSHVVFIFATTMPEKILDTVLSRCIRFNFKTITESILVEHLAMIANKEGIRSIDEGALRAIAREAQGSLRDALSLFDQVLSFAIEEDGPLTQEIIYLALGLPAEDTINNILAAVLLCDVKKCSSLLRGLLEKGVNVKRIALSILDQLYQLIQVSAPAPVPNWPFNFGKEILQQVTRAELFWIYEVMVKDFRWSLDALLPEKVTEIALQKICYRRTFFKVDRRELGATATVATEVSPGVSPELSPQVQQQVQAQVVPPQQAVPSQVLLRQRSSSEDLANNFLDHPFIKETEKIFNSKVNRVFVKENSEVIETNRE
ncbi:MAG: DNA polymerase III subunit gamma/tau [Oligoflexia bacterium]|nr:DNA polymerase III subunit gamma/tau [Oligoflexia bacterium]